MCLDVYFFKSCSRPIILLNMNWDLQEPAHCFLLEVLPKPPTWEHGAHAVHPLRGPHPCSLQDPESLFHIRPVWVRFQAKY